MFTIVDLIFMWTMAAFCGIAGMVAAIRKRRIYYGVLAYLGVGAFGVAAPLTLPMTIDTPFAFILLTLIWPLWLGQEFGYSVIDWTPMWVLRLCFDI